MMLQISKLLLIIFLISETTRFDDVDVGGSGCVGSNVTAPHCAGLGEYCAMHAVVMCFVTLDGVSI